jgi:adenine-specific DNA glycosylase
LPEAEPQADLAAEVARRWGVAATFAAIPPFEHAFTHFTLEIAPWRVSPHAAPRLPAGSMWLALTDIAGAALPSPVKSLLLAVPG